MTKKVTEEMLRSITFKGSSSEGQKPAPSKLDLLGLDFEQNQAQALRAALAEISSDVPRGNGSIDLETCDNSWQGIMWAVRGLNLPEGKEIALEWSKQSDRFDSQGFEDAWNSYDPKHINPIGIGSVFKLADLLKERSGGQGFINKMQAWSSTGDSESMRKEMLEDRFVLEDIAILGQWTTIYASHGVGKTLITLNLLKGAVESGGLDGRKVFYVNADDNYKGSVEKLAIAEDFGIEMLLPNRNGFDPSLLIAEMKTAAQNDQARGIVVILDTLKKFVDLMSKADGTQFGKTIRQFTQAGGTTIGLAHTNKHLDDEGNSIYSGTTDIADDCDCVFILEKTEDKTVPGRQLVEFRNEKARGDVVSVKSFSYMRRQGETYLDLLNSVVVLDPETTELAKKRDLIERQYHKDKVIIDAIREVAATDIPDLTTLIKRVSEDSGKSIEKCRMIATRYSGEGLDEFVFWKISKGKNNLKTLEMHTSLFKDAPLKKPENPKTKEGALVGD
jgi:hypothetical protein